MIANKNAKVVHGIFILFNFLLIYSLVTLPGFWYSPDSFTYYELSKTFFGDNSFFVPNTYRSYLSLEHSASFPPLYPFLIAVLNLIFGDSYLNSAYYNLVIMSLSYLLLIKILNRYSTNSFIIAIFAFSILMYWEYLGEVISGRSIPLALLLVLLSLYFYKINNNLAVFFIGLSCLVRFDLLAFATLLVLFLSIKERKLHFILIFIFSLSPWVAYSLINFDIFWVSDNSWIATSAIYSHVTFFPAGTHYTIFNYPDYWFNRVLGNFYVANAKFMLAISSNLVVLFLFLSSFSKVNRVNFKITSFIFVVLLISSCLVPIYLSGYFEFRYFYLPIFIVGFYLFINVNTISGTKALIFILPFMLIMPLNLFVNDIIMKSENKKKIIDRYNDIETISAIHESEPNVIYFIEDRKNGLEISYMYGAITGNRVAIIPRNYDSISISDFNSYIGDNKTIKPDALRIKN